MINNKQKRRLNKLGLNYMYLEEAKRDRKCKGVNCPNKHKILPMQKCLIVESNGWGNRKTKTNYCASCAVSILEKELQSLKNILEKL